MGCDAKFKGSSCGSEKVPFSAPDTMGARQSGSLGRIKGVNQFHIEEKCWEDQQNSWLSTKIQQCGEVIGISANESEEG